MAAISRWLSDRYRTNRNMDGPGGYGFGMSKSQQRQTPDLYALLRANIESDRVGVLNFEVTIMGKIGKEI